MCTDSRRHFLLQSALLLGVARSSLALAADAGPASAAGATAATGSAAATATGGAEASGAPGETGKVYVCPPCGCHADGREFSQPGKCPACGIDLVEKVADATAQPKVAILVFPGVQIIDFAAPYEVFGEAGYDVFTVGATREPVSTNMHLTITPRYSFADTPRPDVLLLPGGNIMGALGQPPVLDWLRARSAESRQTLSVCNGAFFLAAGRLLDGLEATTYYGLIDQLRAEYPNTRVVSDRRFVDNGKIVTTAGLSSGIDGALHIVSKLSGRAAAQMVALNMEYNWREDTGYARASFADRHLRRVFGGRLQLQVPSARVEVENTSGDSQSWEARWLVHGNMGTAAVTQAISAVVAAQSTWKLVAEGRSDTRRRWAFSDESHRTWQARLTTTQAASNGSVRATLTLHTS